jgi:hypothetical protein
MSSTSGGPSTGRGMNGIAMFFHIRKTFKLSSAVLHDPRVHWAPKLAFLVSAGALGCAVLFPEAVGDLVALGIPGIGWAADTLGLPTEFAFDWVAATVAAFNLLKLFPADIVGEHYDRLFRSRRKSRAA